MDFVQLAGIDDQRDGFLADKGAVRLALRVQRVTARGSRRLCGLGAAAAFEIEDVLVRPRRRDNLDQFARGRREFDEPGAAAAFAAAVAQQLYLNDFRALINRAGSAERGAGD